MKSPKDPRHDLATIEATLADIWEMVLEQPGIDVDDNFFDLGGDSMRAEWMFAEIDQQLEIMRPASLLLEAPTIRELALVLLRDDDHDLLLTIRDAGSLAPLFAVHDGGGRSTILWVRRLAAKLSDDQPVYGIRPPAIEALKKTRNLEDLAARYVELALGAAAGRPLRLFGSSLGGMLAFEMALQLQANGEDVSMLAISDMPAVQLSKHGFRIDAMAGGRPPTRVMVYRYASMRAGRWLIWLRQARLPTGTRRAARRRSAMTRQYRRLMGGYSPAARFEGPLLIFRSDQNRDAGDMGWAERVSGPITAIDLDGVHNNLLAPPNDDIVARALSEWNASWPAQ